MVLKEYMQRGMVKSALILTPTPLVSQWKGGRIRTINNLLIII